MIRADVEVTLDALARHRDDEALVHHDRRLTHGEVLDLVYRTAHVLDERGLTPGDLVVLVGNNEPEMLLARWAVTLLGAGVTQPYAGLSDQVCGRIVDDVEAALVVVAPGHRAEADAVLAHARPTPSIVLDDALLAGADATPVACRARPEDVEEIRHTGGSTGVPKGIAFTFAGHLQIMERTAREGGENEEPRWLVATTVAHLAGLFSDMTLRADGSVVLLDGFDAGEVLATIERERITDVWLLPSLIYRLLDHPDLERTDLSSLRTVVYGGTPAAPTRMAEAVRRIGPVFAQGYGLSEAGAVVSVLTPEDHTDPALLHTVGRPVPNVEIAVCDAEGARVADGERGELWVRTDTTMAGYWHRPELTATKITADGWVRTGDVVFVDGRGYLHVVDRLDDAIIVVGGHIHPPEVESVLTEHSAVREAAVYGAPEADGSQSVHAAVVTDTEVDPAELTDLVTRRQGPMSAPTSITRVEAIPLTDTGKVDRNALRATVG